MPMHAASSTTSSIVKNKHIIPIIYRRMRKTIAYLLTALVCCIACDDNTGTLGNSITPGADSIKIKTNTYYASTRSVKVDSVLGKAGKVYLGRFTDPETDAIFEADFIAQFNCSEGGNVFPPADSIKGDSAVRTELRLFFTTFFGDSTNTMGTEVYELTQTLQEGEKYYTNIDPCRFYDPSSKPLAKKVYTAIDYTLKDNELQDPEHYANVSIPLPNKIGTEMISLYRSNPEFFANASNFIEHICPGYYVKSTYGDGTVLYIDQVALNIYFKDQRTDSVFVTQFVGTEEVLQTNRFNTQKVDDLVEDSTWTYLKTPAGIFTEATLPIAEIMADGDSINSAKIIFTRYNNTYDTPYKFGTPELLLMVRKNEMEPFFEKNKLTDNIKSYYCTYSSKFNRYEFNNIARLIIHCENERQAWIETNKVRYNNDEERAAAAYETTHPNWNKVLLVPVTTVRDSNNNIVNFRHDLSLNSTRLIGGKDKIEIKVISSAFNQ